MRALWSLRVERHRRTQRVNLLPTQRLNCIARRCNCAHNAHRSSAVGRCVATFSTKARERPPRDPARALPRLLLSSADSLCRTFPCAGSIEFTRVVSLDIDANADANRGGTSQYSANQSLWSKQSIWLIYADSMDVTILGELWTTDLKSVQCGFEPHRPY